jgi:hypothetical protein
MAPHAVHCYVQLPRRKSLKPIHTRGLNKAFDKIGTSLYHVCSEIRTTLQAHGMDDRPLHGADALFGKSVAQMQQP